MYIGLIIPFYNSVGGKTSKLFYIKMYNLLGSPFSQPIVLLLVIFERAKLAISDGFITIIDQ